VSFNRTIVINGAAKQAGNILHRELMIQLHGPRKIVPIQRADLVSTRLFSSSPKPIEFALTCQAPASIVSGVVEVGLVTSTPVLPQVTSSSRKLSGGIPPLETRCFVVW
jgi:hypothetical protein